MELDARVADAEEEGVVTAVMLPMPTAEGVLCEEDLPFIELFLDSSLAVDATAGATLEVDEEGAP